MGNLICYPSKPSQILPSSSFLFLAGCNIYAGSKSEFFKLYRNYLKLHFGKSFFCLKSELKRISQQTRLESYEEMIFTYFTIKSMSKVNIMEIFAGIISFSESSYTEKISWAFKIFDFDGNKTITDDELFIMCRCFIDSISLMTNGNSCSNLVIKDLVESSEKTLNQEELLAWVQNSPILDSFFSSSSKSPDLLSAKDPVPKILNIKKKINQSFDQRQLDSKKLKRRTNSSFNYHKEGKFMVVVNGVPVTKAYLLLIKTAFDKLTTKNKVPGALLIKELKTLNIKDLGKVSKLSEYSNFRTFLSDLFPKADHGQVLRMLELVDLVPVSEQVGKAKRRSRRILIEKLFQKFDTNNDGVVDLDELKNALGQNFTHKAIDELFKEHSKNNLGMEVSEFTLMFGGK